MVACRVPLLLGVVILLAPLIVAASVAQTPADATFDTVVGHALARYRLPGLAIGIVRDGQVVYRRTHGVREVGKDGDIDAGTLFKIASNSKAMTSAVLARLVDQGKLKWDDPVVKYLTDFAMYDPWVTREMQVRDLLIHNSGLGAGAGDLMLWPDPNLFTREEVIHGLRYLKPAYSFRSRYAYDNTLYIVAGEVAAKAGGAPYDVLVRRELFEPLGMERCQVGSWKRDAVGNVAQPHALRDGHYVPTRVDSETIPDVPMMAAGGIRCGLDDMLRWARAWLDPDTKAIDGKPWLSKAQRQAVWSPHTIMPLGERMRAWDDSHYSAYGYGWRLTDVDGTAKVSHTGTLGGMYSSLTLLPEKNVGIVILINADADDARTVLGQALVKLFTQPGAAPGVAFYADALRAEQAKAQADAPIPDTRDRQPENPAQIADALGVYRDPWFGDVAICGEGDAVVFRSAKSPKMVGDVMRSGNRMLVQWRGPDVDQEPWLAFETSSDGTRARMARIDPDGDFSSDYQDLALVRVGPCRTQ